MSEHGTAPVEGQRSEPDDVLSPFADAKLMSLTSFRKDGSEVATTVWFALDDGRLLMRTDSTSFKVKRMRRNPSVTVAPCNARGQVKGEPIPGRAVELGPEDGERVIRLYWRRYPVGYGWEVTVLRPVFALLAALKVGKRRGRPIFFEIVPEVRRRLSSALAVVFGYAMDVPAGVESLLLV